MRIRRFLAAVPLVASSFACDEQSKECTRLVASAQEVVLKVDSKSLESVETSLAAVSKARATCEAAGRGREREELTKAENQLRGHLDYLKRRAQRRKEKKLTPEEIAVLEKAGDPSCPKGQAYKHGASGKEIRCAGPQLVDMPFASAKHYFEGRGYKVTAEPGGALKAEFGAELFVFSFDAPEDTKPARCVTLYPAPGVSWQEATSRATGVPPARIKSDAPLSSGRGPVPLRVQDDATKTIVSIGQCDG